MPQRRVASVWTGGWARSVAMALWVVAVGGIGYAAPVPEPKPVPAMQAIPLPEHQISFQREGFEVCRLYHSPALNRPFLFPVIGPAGRSLTRLGHPHDPVTHSHHNSIWVSHSDVDGVNFWGDEGQGRIVTRRVERLVDGPEWTAALTVADWLSASNQVVLLRERRWTTVRRQPDREWLLVVDLELTAASRDVTFGKSSFGPMAVRMAKTIGVHDGGGTMRNSEGGVNEAGCFWKAARWVDYSGPITAEATEGVTLFDHPANPHHPNPYHVRDDGWMGASISFGGPLVVASGKPLRLRYGAWVHAGKPRAEDIDRQWRAFADLPPAVFEGKSAAP